MTTLTPAGGTRRARPGEGTCAVCTRPLARGQRITFVRDHSAARQPAAGA